MEQVKAGVNVLHLMRYLSWTRASAQGRDENSMKMDPNDMITPRKIQCEGATHFELEARLVLGPLLFEKLFLHP